MTSKRLPSLDHIYQNHILDSTRWNHYIPRADDIIVATSYKSGTTWMQNIVLHLIFLGQRVPSVSEVSPWLDSRYHPLDEVITKLESQEHRRCIKTHLPLDGLPFYPQVKYIVVGRSPRDVLGYHLLTSLYANSPEDALAQLESMCLMANPSLGLAELWRMIASTFGLISFQMNHALPDYRIKITQMVEVHGVEHGRYVLQPLFTYDNTEGVLQPTEAGQSWTKRMHDRLIRG